MPVLDLIRTESYDIATIPKSKCGIATKDGQRPVTFSTILSVEAQEPFLLVAGRSDGAISTWRKMGGRELALSTRTPHLGEVHALAYSNQPDLCETGAGLLFSGSTDRTIEVRTVWSDAAVEETCIQTLEGHSSTVTSLVDSRRGFLVSVSKDNTLRVFHCLFLLDLV